MCERIVVYGVTASGKTTLATRIAQQTGLPCHWVDELTWEPRWVQDYPRWLSLGTLLRRTVLRAADGCAICNGNTERGGSMLTKPGALGLLNPRLAGLAMAFSCVFVATNSLRLRAFR